MPLRILHVSDIHFNHLGWDEDLDQRRELVRDVADNVRSYGPIDAILVGGDIAYGADERQYETARAWIDQLLIACGNLEASAVWVVPGNHDVSWEVISKSQICLDFRQRIAETPHHDLDVTLARRLSDDPVSDAIMAPLAAYNDFAEMFGCAVTSETPMWVDDTLEVDGLSVRLTGANSAIASYHDSDKPDQLNLVVGTHQVRLERQDGLIHLVMMHHPPTWLRDWGNLEPYLQRAHVILFGHEHAFGSEQPAGKGGTVHVSAGAVAPERQPGGERDPYLACYNVLTLERLDDSLLVKIDPRYWDKKATRFGQHPGGPQAYQVGLEPTVNHAQTPIVEPSDVDTVAGEAVASASPLLADRPGHEAPLSADEKWDLRKLAVAFYQLPVTRRREVSRSLSVLDDEDLSLPKAELWITVLNRIRDRKLISALEEELRD